MPMKLSLLISASFLTCLLGTRLLSQDAPPPILKTTTRLVQVSVIVQDHKGVPVADLKKENFLIKDNGKLQKISEFSVESNGKLPSAPAKLPPNIFTNELEQRAGTPSSVTIILLDALNTKWEDQAYAKAQVVKFLQTIQPGDRVGIYTLGRGLRVLHDFTTDSTGLLDRLKHFSGQNLPDLAASEPNLMDQAETRALDNWFNGSGGGSGAEADFYTVNRVLGTLHSIEFIANHVARLPGRKNLIWVSGGFPLDIGFDSIEEFHDRFTRPSYVLRGRRSHGARGEQCEPCHLSGGRQRASCRSTLQRGKSECRSYSEAWARASGQESTDHAGVGQPHGGRAYYNTNDLKNAIRDAIGDSQVTYTVGYYPASETFDGKFHKLEVKLADRSGLNIRYRKGYFDQADKPQDDKIRKTELRDAVYSPLDSSALGLIVAVKPVSTGLTVFVKVDQRGMSLQPSNNRWVGRLDMLFIQKDEAGHQYGGIDDRVDLNLAKANYDKIMKEGLIYSKPITVDPKANQLRVIVRDSASGNLGSITVPYKAIDRTPPAPPK